MKTKKELLESYETFLRDKHDGVNLIKWVQSEIDKEHKKAYERGARMQAILDARTIKSERKRVIAEIEAIGITVKIMEGRKEFFPAIEVKDWKRFKKLNSL